jgi:hypothetical protein
MAKVSTLTTSGQHLTNHFRQARKKKEIKGHLYGKARNKKLILSTENISLI